MRNVIDHLSERGFIDAVTSEELAKKTDQPIKLYIGFDPTADSLHLGNLVGIMALAWFQRFGHTPVVILGGATGRIGDPSGKSTERPLLSDETINSNVLSISKHFEKMLDFSVPNHPLIINNNAWYSEISLVDFLRDVGKHFRLGTMLAKDSVKSRVSSEEGMSFTEFSYQLLQSYDFHHLYKNHGVVLQMGGSDQWGNITAGIEYVRKVAHQTVYGATFPLITRSDGKKFGKSEEGAIWLSSDKCSPFQFYQYLVRVADSDVIQLLRMLTFLELEEILSIEASMSQKDYEPNTAQKKLAAEVTRFVHGDEGLGLALKVTEAAAPGSSTELNPAVLEQIAADMPNATLKYADVVGQKYVDIAVKVGLLSSKGEANRLIENGGAYLNNEKVTDTQLRFQESSVIGSKYILLAAGKKKKMLLTLEP